MHALINAFLILSDQTFTFKESLEHGKHLRHFSSSGGLTCHKALLDQSCFLTQKHCFSPFQCNFEMESENYIDQKAGGSLTPNGKCLTFFSIFLFWLLNCVILRDSVRTSNISNVMAKQDSLSCHIFANFGTPPCAMSYVCHLATSLG